MRAPRFPDNARQQSGARNPCRPIRSQGGTASCLAKSIRYPRNGRHAPGLTTPRIIEMYEHSIQDPDGFWGEHGKRLDWMKPYTKVKNVSYDAADLHVKWYEDGVLNASANCLDRHLSKRGRSGRDHLGRRRPPGRRQDHLSSDLYTARLQTRQWAEGTRRARKATVSRSTADDSRDRRCDARLRPDRCGPFRRVRRLLSGLDRRPNQDCESTFVITSDEGLRGGKTDSR